MKEIWKPVVGYEGYYEVSNLGNIKSLRKNKLMSPCPNEKGYMIVSLYKNGVTKHGRVHRLVALAFLENPENKPQVNHINGVKSDNRLENLEFCTNSENQIHAFKIGLQPYICGKDNHNSRPINQYDLEGNFIKRWDCIRGAGRMFKDISNNPQTSIGAVLRGLRKTAFGYIWRYADE